MKLWVRRVRFSTFVASFIAVFSVTTGALATPEGAIPLIDMQPSQTYLGFQGGLYPNSSNEPPTAHHDAGLQFASNVVPRDTSGAPASVENGGAIVLLSIGMSNTTLEYQNFQSLATGDLRINQAVRVMNGADFSQTALNWDTPDEANYDRVRDSVLAPSYTEQQVQVAWVKLANGVPMQSLASGLSYADAYNLQKSLGDVTRSLKIRYPNLQQVFFSSRIYGGYATQALNPEPYAYEGGFSVKWAIESQITQMETGAINSRTGNVSYATGTVPWMAWGPYLWADGATPNSQGLSWLASDMNSGDGTHPAAGAQQKVGTALLNFFLQSPYTAWFRDTVVPTITDAQVTGVTHAGATVTWTTNEATSQYVDYDTVEGSSYANSTGAASPLQTAHSVSLTGLIADTTYHYRVRSVDTAGNVATIMDATFTTSPPPPPDTTAPVISNVQATSTTASSTIITWTTDEAATQFVDLDTVVGPPYESTTGSTGFLTSHSVMLTGLTASTTYHFRVRSADSSANEVATADITFTTAPNPQGVITLTKAAGLNRMDWTSTMNLGSPDGFFLVFSRTQNPPVYPQTTGVSTYFRAYNSAPWNAWISAFNGSGTYYVRVCAYHASNNTCTDYSNQVSVDLTGSDTTPPVISNVQVTGVTVSGATLTWTTNETASQYVDYDTVVGPPYVSNTGSATLATSHTVTLTGLTANTTYHYRVRSSDAAANQAVTTDATFTTSAPPPPDTTAPVISNVQVTNIFQSGATITWTTDEAATQYTDYDTVAGPPYASNTGSATLATSHSVTLTGLTSNTTYHYRVRSSDAAANQAVTIDATFTTTNTPPPAITLARVGTTNQLSWTSTGGLGSPDGFRFVASRTVNPPVYPGTSPITAYATVAYGSGTSWSFWVNAFNGTGTYHFRVCAYHTSNNTCTDYSNQVDFNL